MGLLSKSQSPGKMRVWFTSNSSLRNGIIALVVTIILVHFYMGTSYLVPTTHFYPSLEETLHSASELARNRTLGFQKIFYISLPHRSDRQDGMSLAASFTDIDLTLTTAVKGENVHPKATPPSWQASSAALGCWRSHANIWRKMITEDVSSALIMEDDADWDASIKEELFLISQGILSHSNLVTNNSGIEKDKPYRDDWDIFFLGPCQLSPHENKTADDVGPFITLKDPYMEERNKLRDSFLQSLNHFGVKEEGERVIFRASNTLCTTGYALTKKGAARLLYMIGWEDFGHPVDNVMSWKIQEGKIRGLITSPPLIGMYKTSSSRDSDIDDTSKNEKTSNADGYTQNLKNSARVAMKAHFAPDTPPEEYWAPKPKAELVDEEMERGAEVAETQ